MRSFKKLIGQIVVMGIVPILADVQTVDGVTWKFSVLECGGAQVEGATPVEGELTMPSLLAGHPVVAIGDKAFLNCSKLRQISMPPTVTNIGKKAFQKCLNMSADLVLPENLKSIGSYAFSGCKELETVVFPLSVKTVGKHAFYGCKKVTAVSCADIASWCAVSFADASANPLYYSKKLYVDNELVVGELAVPAGVRSIGKYVFSRCGEVSSVVLPDGLETISAHAFANCSDLRHVEIPETVRDVDLSAFQGCSSLNDAWLSSDGRRVGSSVFEYAPNLENVIIPEGVETIGRRAFYGCSNLVSVVLPSSLRRIESLAFSRCPSLNKATIGFSRKVAAVLPQKVYEQLTSIVLTSTVTNISDNAFVGCDSLESIVIPSSVTDIGKSAFQGCESLQSVTIPLSVTDIGKRAFQGCESLQSVTIPSSVTNIGSYAFFGCKNLRSVVGGAGVKTIEQEAFRRCKSLTELQLPSSIEEIGRLAFHDCPNLTVRLPWNAVRRVKRLMDGSSGLSLSQIDVQNGGAPFRPTVATALKGAIYDGDMPIGILQLKASKQKSDRKTGRMVSRMSGFVIGLDGRKKAIKTKKVDLSQESETIMSLSVSAWGELVIVVGAEGFEGMLADYAVHSAIVGGDWSRENAVAAIDNRSQSSIPGNVQTNLLPFAELAAVEGGKWVFAKPATVKWAKSKETKEYGLVVDTTKGKTNLSGVKLSYVSKTGLFKGSFKLYSLETVNGHTRLKKYSIKVSGAVVDGIGYGTASLKRPACVWDVSVK